MKSFLVKPLAMPVWVVAVLTVGSMVCGIAIGASGATDEIVPTPVPVTVLAEMTAIPAPTATPRPIPTATFMPTSNQLVPLTPVVPTIAPVPTYTPSPVPTAVVETQVDESGFSDVLVWRFCTSFFQGNMTEDQVGLVVGLEEEVLIEENAKRVHRLVMEAYRIHPKVDAELLRRTLEACEKWRDDDWAESQSK